VIRVEHLTVHQGAFAFEDVSFEIPSGQYAVLMGQTGAGKTTLLEVIAGLRRPQRGRVFLNGRDVTDQRPADRGIGYVPQDRALFPTLTVRQNLAFALMIRRMPAQAIERRVTRLARRLSIQNLLDRRPVALSGGEAQRVALGRALASRPSVLLLDEPLNALDEKTATGLVGLLRTLQQDAAVTVLHVTHNLAEAQALASLRLDVRDGRILSDGPFPDRPPVSLANNSSPVSECNSCA
jgi:ABC-type sugar transport system ATPase subunit